MLQVAGRFSSISGPTGTRSGLVVLAKESDESITVSFFGNNAHLSQFRSRRTRTRPFISRTSHSFFSSTFLPLRVTSEQGSIVSHRKANKHQIQREKNDME
jgi:hypothetical protein